MKRSTTFACATVAAALLALPAQGLAQTPPAGGSQPPATAQPQTQPPSPEAAKKDAAREHLAKASAALDEIKTDSLDTAVKKQVAELKRRINTLERTVAANDKASPAGAEQRAGRATAEARGSASWGNEVAAIDKILTALLGPEVATPSPTGTTGAPAAKAARVELDAATRAQLMDVRTHVTAFATAMAGGGPVKKEEATEPEPSAAAPPSTPPPTQEPPAQEPPPESAQAPSGAQPDEQAARRHLTEARNTLSALTQLPAASQLSGEARAQVSQLISSFNELISSQSDWKASYDKVSANLTLLLGPENAPPPTMPPATGTPGAVGTAGTAAIDATIREKLVELRRQLNDFEKAAGGGSTTPSAAADPSAMTNPPTSAPPTSTPPTGAPDTTPATQAPAGAQPAAGNAEIMRHVAAIEALLKSEDDSGGLTLTKMQLEQLRTHWAALKAALDKK